MTLPFIQRAGNALGAANPDDANTSAGGQEAALDAGTWIGANAALNSMLRASNLTAADGRLQLPGSASAVAAEASPNPPAPL